jgi:predicted nucleic acid-binding protein
MADKSTRPRLFIDADVLIAGSASPNEHSASLVLLRMAEITLIEAVTSEQVIRECERNLKEKIPRALPAFQLLVQKSLKIVPDPTDEEKKILHGKADVKDLPILVAASREGCAFLATFNLRHYQPGLSDVQVLKPGELVLRIRHRLASL